MTQEQQRIIDLYIQFNRSVKKVSAVVKKEKTYIRGITILAQLYHGYDFGFDNKVTRVLSDIGKLREDYKTKSLSELAKEHGIPRFLIMYALRQNEIEIKDWNEKSHITQRKIREAKLPQQLLDKQWLINNYVDQGKSLSDIATELGCSISPVRARLKRFNIPIKPPKRYDQGQKSSSSYGIMTKYKPIKCPKKEITFRSLLELGYAMLLDKDKRVIAWDYEVMWTHYFDGFTGKRRKYICDFRIIYPHNIEFDGDREYEQKVVEHVEVKPKSKQTFEDKYLYAKNVIPNWRFITDDEIVQCNEMLDDDLSRVTVPLIWKPKVKKYVVWAKSNEISLPPHHRVLQKRRRGQFFSFRIINDKFVDNNPKRDIKERPKNLHKSHGKNLELDQDRILELVKQDKSAKEIGEIFGCGYRTIIKFLEDRSYVVYWHSNSSRHNEIRHVTKKIWPPDNLPPRKVKRNHTNYCWDNKNWLNKHYRTKGLSTREIGEIVGCSGRLIRKKLVNHNIKLRSVTEAMKLKKKRV